MIHKTLNNKAKNFSRHILTNYFGGFIPFYLTVEYPKSGGSWFGQLISESLKISFPRNKYPILSSSIVHGHYHPTKRMSKIKRIFLVVRDGRDVIVSMYFHMLLWNDRNKKNPKDINYFRSKLRFSDYDNVIDNMPMFIEFVFTHNPSKLIYYNFPGSWSLFNHEWIQYSKDYKNIRIISYESLLRNTNSVLKKALTGLTNEKFLKMNRIDEIVEKYSFKNQTGRNPGDLNKNSFLRKGISGDWVNYFNNQSCKKFKDYSGDMLITLGYEKNNNWGTK